MEEPIFFQRLDVNRQGSYSCRMRHLVSCLLQAVTITYITDNAYLQWMFISWSTSWDFHYKWANVIGAFHKNLGQNACEVIHGSLLV